MTKTGGLSKGHLFSHSPGDQKPRVEAPRGLVSAEVSPFG